MDSKLYRGRLRYLVKWKGREDRPDWTWEPLSSLTHADEAIADYHKKHPSAPRPIDSSLPSSLRRRFHHYQSKGHTYDVSPAYAAYRVFTRLTHGRLTSLIS